MGGVTRRLSAGLIACLLPLAGSVSGLAAEEAFPLSHLSGTWVGRYDSVQTGECGHTDGEDVAVVLTIAVTDDGDIEVKNGPGAVLGTGTVSAATWRVDLHNSTAAAKCGEEPRDYEIHYTGFFRREGDDLRLQFEGQNDPCPPRCRFLDRYRVKKQDIEE
jgi:hypothetical protein